MADPRETSDPRDSSDARAASEARDAGDQRDSGEARGAGERDGGERVQSGAEPIESEAGRAAEAGRVQGRAMRLDSDPGRSGPHPIPPPPRSLLGVSAPRERLISDEGETQASKKAARKGARPRRELPTLPSRRRLSPRTGRRSKASKRFWPRKLKFTREGKYFLGITLGVGFAAINTGNNLLYLLLGMMLSLIIVSGVMSELSLRTLTVKRRLPSRAQVGRSHLVEIEVYNDKARVPSYAIEVEDLRAGQPADKRCFFLKISPRSTQVAAYRRTPARRGLERHTGFRIATRFPFGLFEKSREVEAADELIIYPAVDPVRLPRRGVGDQSGHMGLQGRGAGEEIYALRPMRDGDDPRDIYWRKSTVPSQLVLRERAREMRREVELRLDVKRAPSDDEELRASQDEAFEKRVREVASHAVAHIKRGDRVLLRANNGQRVASDRSRGIDPVLRFLALIRLIEVAADEPAKAPRAEAAE